MIRINLLREGRGAKRGGPGGPPMVAVQGPTEEAPPWGIYVALLLATVVATGGYGAWLLMQNHSLAVEIERQKVELKKYEGAREKVAELEKKKTEYAAKVDQIKELKDQQSIPVKLMNRLVEVLPEGAWYNAVKQNNQTIELTGAAKSIKTISTLYDNLVAISEFANVQLGEVQQQSGAEETYSYKLSMNYHPGGFKPKVEEAKPQATSARARSKPASDDSGGME